MLTIEVDWTLEMGGSTIATQVWTLQSGITNDSDGNTTAAGEAFEKEFFVRVRRQLVG